MSGNARGDASKDPVDLHRSKQTKHQALPLVVMLVATYGIGQAPIPKRQCCRCRSVWVDP